MPRVFLGLGSNKGDRLRFLQEAYRKLRDIHALETLCSSVVYETSPYGLKEQGNFLNAVVGIQTDIAPALLYKDLRTIETFVGRTPSVRWGPREIDIDLLLYGDVIIRTDALTLPHPGLAERRFVLVPLAEIAPHEVDPRSRKTISELLETCPDTGTVTRTQWTLTSQEQEQSLARGK